MLKIIVLIVILMALVSTWLIPLGINMNDTSDPAFEFVERLSKELSNDNFDLPAFPETALMIQEAMKDPNVSIDSLSTMVLTEPMLAARLMRLANSAMMQRGTHEITDIKTAISRIGLNMVQTASVSLAANKVFKAPSGSLLKKHLTKARKHSVKVCTLAYILARKVDCSSDPDVAMLAGLLHAIGKFYILSRVDAYPKLLDNEEALESLMNEWHTGVGRAIVEHWGFSEQIVEAVDEHEVIDRAKFGQADTTDIIIVANLLAKPKNADSTEEIELDGIPSLSRMKTDGDSLRNLIKDSEDELNSMTQAFAS